MKQRFRGLGLFLGTLEQGAVPADQVPGTGRVWKGGHGILAALFRQAGELVTAEVQAQERRAGAQLAHYGAGAPCKFLNFLIWLGVTVPWMPPQQALYASTRCLAY